MIKQNKAKQNKSKIKTKEVLWGNKTRQNYMTVKKKDYFIKEFCELKTG